jgi:hypothetical protein
MLRGHPGTARSLRIPRGQNRPGAVVQQLLLVLTALITRREELGCFLEPKSIAERRAYGRGSDHDSVPPPSRAFVPVLTRSRVWSI